MKHEYQTHEVLIIAFSFMVVGLICGVGMMGAFTQNPCNGEIHRTCVPHQTGNDLVYLITNADNHSGCALAVDTNNIVGWKCPRYFMPEEYQGFNLIVDGNWQKG